MPLHSHSMHILTASSILMLCAIGVAVHCAAQPEEHVHYSYKVRRFTTLINVTAYSAPHQLYYPIDTNNKSVWSNPLVNQTVT